MVIQNARARTRTEREPVCGILERAPDHAVFQFESPATYARAQRVWFVGGRFECAGTPEKLADEGAALRVALSSVDAQENKDTVVFSWGSDELPKTGYVGSAYLETEVELGRHTSTLYYTEQGFVLRYALFRALSGQTGDFYFEKYFLDNGALSSVRCARERVLVRAPEDLSKIDPLETRPTLIFSELQVPFAHLNENVKVVHVAFDSELHASARLDERASELDTFSRYRDRFHTCVVTDHPYSFVQCFLKGWEVARRMAEHYEAEFLTEDERAEIDKAVQSSGGWTQALLHVLNTLFVDFPAKELRMVSEFTGSKRELHVLTMGEARVRAILARIEAIFGLEQGSLVIGDEAKEKGEKANKENGLPSMTAYQRVALAECLAELRAYAYEDIPYENILGDKLRSQEVFETISKLSHEIAAGFQNNFDWSL